MPDALPLPDPGAAAIATQTFKLARKGYDPDEVRAFLEEVQTAVRNRAPAPTGTPSPEALLEAQRVVEAAQRQAQAVLSAAPVEAPVSGAAPADPVTDAVRRADEIIGAASARVDALKAEAAGTGDGGGDRWGDLGGHVARILQEAEADAGRVATEAEEAVVTLAAQAAQDRAATTAVVAQAEAKAAAVVAGAEADAGTLVEQAEPRIEAHLVQARAQAVGERDAGQAALAEVVGDLRRLQETLDQRLAERDPSPGLPGPLHFLVAPPAAPGTGESDAVAAAPPVATP